jgi:hypothetical protein
MRESEVGHRRWAAGSVALVVVLGLAGCGSASNRAVPAKASPAAKKAALANWKPRLGQDEERRIDDCLLNVGHVASVARVPSERALVDFLPHLLYYAGAEYGVESSDALVDMTIYIFDSRSTAERWARISRANAAAEILRTRDFAHSVTDSEVRRTGSVVSVWLSPTEVGSFRPGARCSTR